MRTVIITLMLAICLCGLALGQSTETVLYSFGGYAADGVFPEGSPLFDAAGNIYGTTSEGGKYCQNSFECGGTVYELSPTVGGGWSETILYNFCTTGNSTTCADGSYPYAGLIMDVQGNLYGTTAGGGTNGLGIVFRLSPPAVAGESWTQTVLWTFSTDPENGEEPLYGNLNMDAAGNIYGTSGGGSKGLGAVFELSPQPNGTYSFSILHSFSGSDGYGPVYGVTFDSAGNLYGTTTQGGRGKSICQYGCGLIYRLSPSGGTWEETVLFEFDGVVGAYPVSPISIDKSGNLYGTFETGGGGECLIGIGTCGGVFKLVPGTSRKYAFYFNGNGGVNDGNPQSGVAIGAGNSLFGAAGVEKGGIVYLLQGQQETILYNFCSLPNCADGSFPSLGNIVIRDGALYGTTVAGGLVGGGVVYSLTK
jgi:uncharacterized repeat protein (TIGR03803 family)